MRARLTPKYVTAEMVEKVVDMVLKGFVHDHQMTKVLNGGACHIVVLVPSIEDDRVADYPNWPDYSITPFPIFEKSVGNSRQWPHEFDIIARCKAQQLWRGQNTDGNTDSMPHLLFPDDTPFWGGVKRHGIVVACSGFQPYFDQMISGMIADAIKAFARFYFEKSDDKKEDRDFLA